MQRTKTISILIGAAAVLLGISGQTAAASTKLGPAPLPKGARFDSNSAASVNELVERLITALQAKDAAALHRLRVNEKEYLEIIVPGNVEPGQPPQHLTPPTGRYFWETLNGKSAYMGQFLLNEFGGRSYKVRDVTYEKGTKKYAWFTGYRQLPDQRRGRSRKRECHCDGIRRRGAGTVQVRVVRARLKPGGNLMLTSIRILVSVFVGLTLVAGPLSAPAVAGLVPGKGKAKTNCYVEYDIQGVTNPGSQVQNNGGRVLCTDGDPCDTDGQCGNNSCTFQGSVCINQTDANVASCAAPAGLTRVKVGPKKLNIGLPQLLQGPLCASPVSVAVKIPTKKNGKPKKGFASVKLTSNAKAAAGTKPGAASDSLELRCVARTTSCPPTEPECHNGRVDGGELCDTNVDTDECVNCQGPTTCGDGFTGANEACDDGNTQAGDGCSPTCTIEGGGVTAVVTLNYDPQAILDLAGLELNVAYPPSKVGIPGNGNTDQVKARVTNLGDPSNNFEASDDDSKVLVVTAGVLPPGPLAQLIFDSVPGQTVTSTDFGCEVRLAIDSFGLNVGPPTCSVAVTSTSPTTSTTSTSTTSTSTSTSTTTTIP